MKKSNRIGTKLTRVSIKIEKLQHSGEDVRLRREFGLPDNGFKADIGKRDEWLEKLSGNDKRYSAYNSALKKLGDRFDFDATEMETLEDYLLSGEPVVWFNGTSRIKIEAVDGESTAWVRVDGLTIEQILEEIEKLKEIKPEFIKASRWKPTRSWEHFLAHQRIFKMNESGMSAREIVDKLTKEVQALPDSDPNWVMTEDNVRQILRRYKERLKKVDRET